LRGSFAGDILQGQYIYTNIWEHTFSYVYFDVWRQKGVKYAQKKGRPEEEGKKQRRGRDEHFA